MSPAFDNTPVHDAYGDASQAKVKAPTQTPEYEALLSQMRWGTNHDPALQFCGPYDCYAVLGLSYEEHKGEGNLDMALVKAQYRAVSRKYHPDKVKRLQRFRL